MKSTIMNWNRAEELLEKYYAGQTSIEEEKELKHLLSRSGLPPHLKQEQALFNQMQAAAGEETVLTDDKLFSRLGDHQKTEKNKAKTIKLPVKAVWQVAAAIALLLTGYWLGAMEETGPPDQRADARVQTEQLTAIQKEVEEMKQLLSQNSPSQRIKAVNHLQESGASDEELMEALIQTMHFDENVNVRMAAIRALLHFQDHPLVRKSLIQSLQIQSDPNVQLQLIDGLVGMGEKKAVPHMQELLKNKELQEVVKSRLQQGIGILI